MPTLNASDSKKPPLSPVDIELTDRFGSFVVDVLRASIIGASNALPLLGEPFTSDISGKPAFGYRTHQVSLALAGPELLRLLRRDLLPAEAKALFEKFGVFHEINKDFYDPDTFEALQPISADAEAQ